MGVLKNDVGRPSNKTIRIRFVLKAIFVIIVASGLFAGGYLLNDISKNKNINQENNQETNKQESNKQTGVNKDVYAKYKDLVFYTGKEVGDEYGNFVLDHTYSAYLKVIEGKINTTLINRLNNTKEEINTVGIDSKVKYISIFENFYYDAQSGPVVALTEDNKAYYGFYDSEKKEFSYSLISNNIVDMKIEDIDSIGLTNVNSSSLYLLTSKGELRLVQYNHYHNAFVLTDELYENRHIYFGNYHQGGSTPNVVLNSRDNTLSFVSGEIPIDNGNIYKNFMAEEYNGKKIVVKELFICSEGTEYKNQENLYVVTLNNEILKTKESKGVINLFEFELYKKVKVKNVEFEKQEGNSDVIINITYEDGSTEKKSSWLGYYKEK